MSGRRLLVLILGPLGIVGASYYATMPGAAHNVSDAMQPYHARHDAARSAEKLDAACQEAASELSRRLGPDCTSIVRTPYVLGGDLTEAGLDRCHHEIIIPTQRALSTLFFDHAPDEPVILLLFSGDDSYRRYAELLDGRQQPNYAGYYQRSERRVVLNIGTGDGTLAHELTHALAHFDFPNLPEWFDEGLGALVEQSTFSADGLRLVGESNWRLNYLLPAVRSNQLRPLESLVSTRNVRPDNEAVDYAHARYFCLYLQKRELLCPYYRKFRAHADKDPTGLDSLRTLLGDETLDEVDRDFREWVLTLAPRRR